MNGSSAQAWIVSPLHRDQTGNLPRISATGTISPVMAFSIRVSAAMQPFAPETEMREWLRTARIISTCLS